MASKIGRGPKSSRGPNKCVKIHILFTFLLGKCDFEGPKGYPRKSRGAQHRQNGFNTAPKIVHLVSRWCPQPQKTDIPQTTILVTFPVTRFGTLFGSILVVCWLIVDDVWWVLRLFSGSFKDIGLLFLLGIIIIRRFKTSTEFSNNYK